jgi:arylsulfatase B
MLSLLDQSVGAVVSALSARGMLSNSIILFTTDNGGPAGGFNLNAASNWPLRGVKDTVRMDDLQNINKNLLSTLLVF